MVDAKNATTTAKGCENVGETGSLIPVIVLGACLANMITVAVIRTAQLIKENNWGALVGELARLMAQAETLFVKGADKKAWVLQEIQAAAKLMDFELDAEAMQKISSLIDALCAMAKRVNIGGGKL